MADFITFYQNLPQMLSPTIFEIGVFQIRWYSMGYLVAFMIAGLVVAKRITLGEAKTPHKKDEIIDCLMVIFFGVLLGGRLGYAIFYQPEYYLFNLLEIFLPIKISSSGIEVVGIAGMSYHGGIIGGFVGLWIFCKYKKYSFTDMWDLYVPGSALGYTFGRLGNFMNGELYGRKTEMAIGMYFNDHLTGETYEYLRHPSQLYEAFLEGIVTFGILWVLRKKNWPSGSLGSSYLMLYALARTSVEFFRQPDKIFTDAEDSLGVVFLSLTMGQSLSVIMFLLGLGLFLYFMKRSDTRHLAVAGSTANKVGNNFSTTDQKREKNRKKRNRNRKSR